MGETTGQRPVEWGPKHTYFTYDAAGERVRKVYEHDGIVEERIYLGGYELYRRRRGTLAGPVQVERQTLHVMDDTRRVALVETKTVDTLAVDAIAVGVARWRYQLDNHLGSSALELSETAAVISYEEYHPYGTTAFHSTSGAVSQKRYRYTGKEKDEETGLYYHGARYYAPSLGRWTAADPAQLEGSAQPGSCSYEFVDSRPVVAKDPDGRESVFVSGMRRPQTPADVEAERRAAPKKEAFERGRSVGRAHGEYAAWVENLTTKLSTKYNGVSVLDRMTDVERTELATKFVNAYRSLPSIPDEAPNEELGRATVAGFDSGFREQFEVDQRDARLANIGFEVAKLAAPLLVGALSSLRQKVVVDLFGGRSSQVRGAINVDINAETGFKLDVLKGLPFKSGSVDEILVTNPYLKGLPAGSNAANTYLPEAARILKEGGRIVVTGGQSNKFARIPPAEELNRLGLRVVQEPGKVTDPRILSQTMVNSTSGKQIDIETLQSYVLQKVSTQK